MRQFPRNIPHVHLHEKRENKEHWHGAEIQVVIEGNWTTYRVCNTYFVKFKYFRSKDMIEQFHFPKYAVVMLIYCI